MGKNYSEGSTRARRMPIMPLILGGTSLLGAGAYAEGSKEAVPQTNPNVQVSTQAYSAQNDPHYWTADGILVTPAIVDLKREDIQIDSLISGGNASIYAMDPIRLLEGKLNFIYSNEQALNFYSKEARWRMLDEYDNLLKRLQNQKRSPQYAKSLENLAQAVKDGIITKQELETITEGVYAIGKSGSDPKTGEKYDAPMLVHLPGAEPNFDYEKAMDYRARMSEEEMSAKSIEQQKTIPERTQKVIKRHGLARNPSWETSLSPEQRLTLNTYLKNMEGKRFPAPETAYEPERTKEAPKEIKPVSLDLIAGINASIPGAIDFNEAQVPGFALANGAYGGELGIKIWRIGFTGSIGARSNRSALDIREEIDAELFPGIYSLAKGDLQRFFEFGGNIEYHQPIANNLDLVLQLGIRGEKALYLVQKQLEGPAGTIGIPEIDFPIERSRLSALVAAGPSIKIARGIRFNPLAGVKAVVNKNGIWQTPGNAELYFAPRIIGSLNERGN
jgi:hypothetical protein